MQKSETIKKIDPSIFDFTDIEIDSVSEVELTTDLGDLIMLNQTNETFDDLLKRNPYNTGNLYILSRIRLMLHDNGILYLINSYNGTIDDSYLTRMEILLNKGGFIDLEIINSTEPKIVRAVRRPLISKKLGYGLIFREVLDPDEISRGHRLAKTTYNKRISNKYLAVQNQST